MNSTFLKASLLTAVFVGIAATSVVVPAQQRATPPQIKTARQTRLPQNPDFSKLEVQTLKVQGNVHLLWGAGANITVQTGDQGLLLVDTGYEQMAGKVLAGLRKLSDRPIRTIVNTTLADDHTGANGPLVKAGSMNQAGPGLGARPNEGDLIAHNGLLRLMSMIGEAKISTDRWPPSTYPGRQKDLHMNDEPVIVMHIPSTTTSGDSMVWFRKSDVIATGDVLDLTSFPYIDLANGGSINGTIEALNTLLDIMVPKHHQEGGTMVIPGHGRVADEHDVLEYRDMVTIVRDRVQNAIKKGMTLQQVRAAKPSVTYEYEPRFNRNPAWTPEMFVEATYRSLSGGK
jgi:glyoxylase-like metal-dependent hydrolase (beta-lactamase superfamily II)